MLSEKDRQVLSDMARGLSDDDIAELCKILINRRKNNVQPSANNEVAINKLNVGDSITFGRYPQGCRGEIAPIIWTVLKTEGGKALLLSKFALDAIPFNNCRKKLSFKDSDLFRWLNSDFISAAFTPEEQEQIVYKNADIKNPKILFSEYIPERVSLLSELDIEEYFDKESDRACMASSYCLKNALHFVDNTLSFTWVNAPTDQVGRALTITPMGEIIHTKYADDNTIAIRPVIWINNVK